MLSDWLSRTYKNFRRLLILSGVHLGGESYKAKPYYKGGREIKSALSNNSEITIITLFSHPP